MSFAEIVYKAWSGHHLFSVLLELTYRCNLDCFFCYNDLGLDGEPLSREQYLRLLDDLHRLEVLNLILSGGEPLTHPEFFTIGSRARELGFVVRIKSNGHALRGTIARRIRDEIDPFVIELSLHGATAATHDRQTRVMGSFERLLANLEEVLGLGLRVKLNGTLTRWNEGEVEGMMELAQRLAVPLQIDPEVTPRDDGDRTPLSIAASPAGLFELFRLQRSRAERAAAVGVGRPSDAELPERPAGLHCGAGAGTLAVDPYGNVYPCVQWRRPVGNLHRRSIGEIWSGSPALDEVRRLNGRSRRAVEALGPDGGLVGFCPGSARMDSGDPTLLHPRALERLELRRRARDERRSPLPVVG